VYIYQQEGRGRRDKAAPNMALKLRITLPAQGKTKAMQFNSVMSVGEVLNDILTQLGVGGPDHGLLRPQDKKTGRMAKWLEPIRTLQFYDIGNGVRF